jgi:energy-coupling factor transport system ATP-binding protein
MLDEPTRGLDYEAKRALAKIIRKLQVEGKALFIASHDIEFVAQVADEIIVLSGGRVSQAGAPWEILGAKSALASQVSIALQTEGLFTIEQVVEP